MATDAEVLRFSDSVASEEFYGDSDCDENPFQDPPYGGGGGGGGGGGITIAASSPGSDKGTEEVPTKAGFSTTIDTTMPVALPRDGWHRFPAGTPGSTSFPALPDINHGFGVGLRAAPDMLDAEVETETEGETENDDSGSDGEQHYDNGSGAAGSASRAEGPGKDETDWVSRIDRQLRNARAGRADPHAMRQLLRKAGFVPESRRKDIWRLLILGRVEAGVGSSSGVGGGGTSQADVLALDAAILSTELDLDNQRVVRVDVERTRPALEQFKRPRVKNLLARILTHHCKTQGLGYKQGMHEVLAPFVALSDPELPTSDISLCYGAFIKRFLPYAFNKDEEFLSLQICFRLFRLLLLYHHPRLCRFLDQYQLQPELYATPWFLTLFANSLDLPRLYEVWDFYLYWGDPALHHFVVLAFVIGNAEVILQAEEANLPETMCRLSVGMRSIEELRALMRTAKDLMLNTPKSFRKILRSALYANLSQSQMNLVLNTLQVSSCIPVSAEEVISYILHKNPHRQLDQESDDESVLADNDGAGHANRSRLAFSSPPPVGEGRGGGWTMASPSPQRVAERAAMRSLRGHRQYIIMDCRPREEFDACRLAPALHLDPDLLVSPDDLDAKLKEFNPLQGVAHFCLVGAGGGAGAIGQRKNTGPPSDLSGEAMGLRPTSLKVDSTGPASSGGASSKGDRVNDAGGFAKPDAAASREKDGGFNWMGGLTKALSRAHEDGAGREGEEEVGREEDVQVARFVLMLLQYNFPYISHVRGDMTACLQELSAQALDETADQHVFNGDTQETLHGVLIGTDADRVREQLTRCSPEKKVEGLFAGLAKWSKEKGDSASTSGGGGDGSDTVGRRPSWIGRDSQAADRGDANGKNKKKAEAAASRGRGGMGRRDNDDQFVEVVKPQDEGAETKPSKRRLFGGVLHRFDKSEGSRGGGGGGTAETDSVESPLAKDGSSLPSDPRRWMAPNGSKSSKAGGAAKQDGDSAAASTSVASPGRSRSSASGSDAQDDGNGKPAGTWVKHRKGATTPDRFARFLGKMLGVKDDALPDTLAMAIDRSGEEDDVGADTNPKPAAIDASVRTSAARGEDAAPRAAAAAGTGTSAASAADTEDSTAVEDEERSAARSAPHAFAPGAEGRSGTTSPSTVASDGPVPEASAITATAVYPATTFSTATADAMPVAVAVAVALPVDGGATAGSDPPGPVRRPSRSHRTNRSAGTVGARPEGEASTTSPGDTVLISEWVTKEERESGGRVRVFSAHRVLEGKVQKKCRLAVSPKNMTQFDGVHEGVGGTRGVINEHRGLRHLSRITSRRKHADLIVFHFKSRSGTGGSAAAAAAASGSRTGVSSAASGGGGGGSSSSRRSRTRSTWEGEGGQPDVLFYFMREHTECLRMVKENYRKVTQGSGQGSSSKSSSVAAPAPAPAQSARKKSGQDSSGRQTARAAAGAAAGAAGLVVGAVGGIAVGAAAGVAVGAAFLAGHRKGANDDLQPRSSSPSRRRRSRGGGEDFGRVRANSEVRRNSGGWIPIDPPGEERRRSDGGSSNGRPSSAGGSRRTGLSSTGGSSRGHRSARGGSAGAAASTERGDADGPRWLSRG